ncbi:cysteine desulfurase family protein [Alphaproteobacteria bacterium endosymbiont of Tiliacea citrago]|uniref:cysteine desulfurase family protein n=1 Tax=Alphaproteobacteria bacterium endosymbiont of Tiliacea citrago TaxID=3077944 RepID=UPI00313AD1E0
MIFLDAASSEKLHPKAKIAMLKSFDAWANPSSLSQAGKNMSYKLKECRETIKKCLNVKNNAELIFTSSASESNNHIFNSCDLPILISKFEHPSVYNHPKVEGVIDLNFELIEQKIKDKKYLISISLVNNESGIILATKELVDFIKKFGSKVHIDASQAKNINFDYLGCDYMTLSSHKIGGPVGVAAIISKSVLSPILYGGGQEFGVRSSTEAVPLISGFAAAVEEIPNRFFNDKILSDYLKSNIDKKYFFSNFVDGAFDFVDNIHCLLTYGLSGTEVFSIMDLKNIIIAYGSACSSGTLNAPKILSNFDLPSKNGIRVSFSWDTSIEDLKQFVEVWKSLVFI